MRIAPAYVGAVRQAGGALCCDTSVGDSCLSRWVATAPEHYSASRYQRSQRAHFTCIPAFFARHATGLLGSLLARCLSPSAHKTCRGNQTSLWRRPSVPNRQVPAAETLQSASSGWHSDSRADRLLPNRTLHVLARARPPYTVDQTMYSPSSPP
jgi:hypothetical protein